VKRVISVGNNTYTDVSSYIIPLKYNVTSPNIVYYSIHNVQSGSY